MHEHETGPRRAVVVAVQVAGVEDVDFEESIAELGRLAKTLGLLVVGRITQKRSSFDAAAYVGPGKLEELKAFVESELVEVVVLDHEITPSQSRNLEKETGAEIMDRTFVILEIFQRHAHSRAAKAQVELARLQYTAPRLRESPGRKDRVRGGIGGKGAGESHLELDRRKIRDRMVELEEQLATIGEEQRRQRTRRKDFSRVALVGYTNAGKSTLMRAHTASEVLVADKLFATLDTTVRVLVPETRPRILVSDTVGFIRKLPHGLVASFRSTLEEALEAALLCHVVDASDPAFEGQLDVTVEVLEEIGAGAIPRLLVFNKIDRVGDAAAQAERTAMLLERWPDSIVLSAKDPADVSRMRDVLIAFFARGLVESDIVVPYDRQELRRDVYESGEVLGEDYLEEGVSFRVRAHPGTIERIRLLVTAPAKPRQS